MKAIGFVVRDDAGALQRGSVAANAQTSTITAGFGQEISLNLRQIDLSGHSRDGANLTMVLADGRIVVIEGFFNDTGEPNRLFISADGYLNEVTFVETTDGALYAQYGPTEQWGKWSPSDDLIYLGRTEISGVVVAGDEDVSMLGAAVLGVPNLLGLGAGAALVGTTFLGEEGTAAPAPAVVHDADTQSIVGGDDTAAHRLDVTGSGQPGDRVRVQAGAETLQTTVAGDGTWSVRFEGDDFPPDGAIDTTATFTRDGAEVAVLSGPAFLIDTVPPALSVTQGAASTGDLANAETIDSGVTIAGTSEPGARVEVTTQGVTRSATASAEGTWSVTYQAGVLAPGEYDSDIVVIARDAAGNSTTLNDQLVVDTVTDVSIDQDGLGTNGVLNAAGHAEGLVISGTAQPGAQVAVTFSGVTQMARVDAAGAWQAPFSSADIAMGSYEGQITAVATDTAGNTASATTVVQVDTSVAPLDITSNVGGADGILNAAEAQDGIRVTGQVEPGSRVMLTLGAVTVPATVAADGSWQASFSTQDISSGTYTATMIATATDAAGNVESVSQEVQVDTVAGLLTLIAGPIAGDDIINAAEARDGVTVSGTADPGAVVQVALGGVTHAVRADANGDWQAAFAAGEVPQGVYTAQIQATTTDAAGNMRTVTDNVAVDTRVDNLSVAANAIEGDNIISGAEQADGVVVTGTTEPGSAVFITMGAATGQGVVDANGNWSAQFSAAQIPTGEYSTNVTVTATDAARNVASATKAVAVDTLVNQLSATGPIAGDDTVNAAEATTGVTLSGVVEPGSVVMVNFAGADYPAVVDVAGNWQLVLAPAAIPLGQYEAQIGVTATDAVDNVETITHTLRIDTTAPEGPVVASFTRDGDGIRGISTEISEDALAVAQVQSDGTIATVEATSADVPALGETLFQFDANVPDGSHLVVTATDAAGNQSGTYVVLDDESANSTVDLSNPGLSNYEITQVDLQFAEEAQLSINAATLGALAQHSDTLTIHGGADDTVSIAGGVRSGSKMQGGQRFDVYSVGADGTLLVEDEITVNTLLG